LFYKSLGAKARQLSEARGTQQLRIFAQLSVEMNLFTLTFSQERAKSKFLTSIVGGLNRVIT